MTSSGATVEAGGPSLISTERSSSDARSVPFASSSSSTLSSGDTDTASVVARLSLPAPTHPAGGGTDAAGDVVVGGSAGAMVVVGSVVLPVGSRSPVGLVIRSSSVRTLSQTVEIALSGVAYRDRSRPAEALSADREGGRGGTCWLGRGRERARQSVAR